MGRIGLFGGSFDPFHLGHAFAARAAAEAFGLDRVLLAPCAVSPFKMDGAAAPAPGEDRLEMVRLSVEGDPLFEPCGIELRRPPPSYAVDTVSELRAGLPAGTRLFLIIGADSLPGLSRWRDAARLLSLCEVVTVARPGAPLPAAAALGFPPETAERLLSRVIPGRLCDVSSSEIRRRVAEGRPIRYLVAPAVERYIRRRRLYAASGRVSAASGRVSGCRQS